MTRPATPATASSTSSHWLRQQWHGLVDFLLPPACPLCLQPLPPPARRDFCPACRAAIPPLPPACCPLCSEPFATSTGRPHLCGDCLRQRPAFDRVHAAGLYGCSLRAAIHRFKFGGVLALDSALARLLADALPAGDWDLLVPVPLHPDRLRQRTCNQALLLARRLSPLLMLPVAVGALRRLHFRQPQQGLQAPQRHANVAGAFAAGSEPVAGRAVLLVDDVMTTGATLEACSRILRDAGALRVEACVVARASRHLPPATLDAEGAFP